jgi:hypothetical protein
MAVAFSFLQPEQYQVEPGTGDIRCQEVDEDGVVLSTGTDCMGNAFASVYQIGAILKTGYKDAQPVEIINNEASEQIALSYGAREMRLDLDLYGYVEHKDTTGSILWFSLEKLVLAKRFWKVAFYQKFKTGTNTYYIKKVFWKCIFEPKIEYTREAGQKKIIPCSIIPLIKTSATADAEGGQHFKKMHVAAIVTFGTAAGEEGGATSGFENQGEVTS